MEIAKDAGCTGVMKMMETREERGRKKGKGRKGSKTSDAKGRADGQMREGSSRAGNGFEERKKANGGPCLTNCHLR